jgi:protein-tyrosine-phosphatase
MSGPLRILCVCSGNTCRSPMLKALLRAAVANAHRAEVQVDSAGTGAADGEPASLGAQRAMQRRGLSLADHAATNLRKVDLGAYRHFWCMTASHAAAVRALGIPAAQISVVNEGGGGVPDPFGGDDQEYEATAQVLELAAREIAQDL